MYRMVTTPDETLLETAAPVVKFDKKLKDIVSEMQATLDATVDPVGVGLAAPQVGISKRIFLSKPKENGKTTVFINPEIIETTDASEIIIKPNPKKVELMKKVDGNKSAKGGSASGKKGTLLEGCLSVPNIWGNVLRKHKIKLSYQDLTGTAHTKELKGFSAIIVQHEIDHLNGVLFTKHVLSQGEQLYRSYKNDKGEDEFEEIEV